MHNYDSVILGEFLVLREIHEHDLLVSLILNKNMAGWRHDITTQRTKRSYQSVGPDLLVAERAAFVAGIAKDSRSGGCFIFDQISFSLEDLKLREDSKLQAQGMDTNCETDSSQKVNRKDREKEANTNWQCQLVTYLHRCASLLSAEATVAPTCQGWVTSDLSFEISAHAGPGMFSHG